MNWSLGTLLLLGCALFPMRATADEQAKSDKPNIILILADDISAREFALYGSTLWSPPLGGNTSDPAYRAKTPVLDQLAEEGIWVTNCWAATVCSPSRAMMMTDRYAHVHKWWTNKERGQVQRENGRRETWPLYESSPMQIGHVAQQGGYATFWTGKTQMAGDLRNFGFDEGVLTPGRLADTDNPYTDFKHYMKKVGGQRKIFDADTDREVKTYLQHGWYWYPHVLLMRHASSTKEFEWWPNTPESRREFGLTTYGPDVEQQFAFEFMERQHRQGRPFFIYHCSHLGHDAYDWLNPESKSKWPGTPIISWDGTGYTRMEPKIDGDKGVYNTHGTVTEPGIRSHIEYLDYQMWLYRRKLEELGIDDNTIIIFTADNGTWGYGKHNPGKQRGTHVPLIIHAPGMTKKGRQDILVNFSDFLPTIAEITGVELPPGYEVNGDSLWPFLMSDKDSHRDWVYAHQGRMQLIRGANLLRDGRGDWFNVADVPEDLDSFRPVTDWEDLPDALKAEKAMLEEILPRFDLYRAEYNAPGTPPDPSNNPK